MTENELLAHVYTLARGLVVHHHTDSRRDPYRGLPDVIIVGRTILWREIKAPGEKLRSDQMVWAHALQAAHADYSIWTLQDLKSGRIAKEISQIRFS